MNHHWIRLRAVGLFCINCGDKRVCSCAIDLNLWTRGHVGNCQLHLSRMPACQPAIPEPVERPFERVLSPDELEE